MKPRIVGLTGVEKNSIIGVSPFFKEERFFVFVFSIYLPFTFSKFLYPNRLNV
jgi:hypothetical protein